MLIFIPLGTGYIMEQLVMPNNDITTGVADYAVKHTYSQQFFSVHQFLEVARHDFSDSDFDTQACVMNLDMGYFRSRLVYRQLHSDVLIFDQDVVCDEAESSLITANPEGKYYLFKYVYALNHPLKAVFNGHSCYLDKGFFGFCSNDVNHEVITP